MKRKITTQRFSLLWTTLQSVLLLFLLSEQSKAFLLSPSIASERLDASSLFAKSGKRKKKPKGNTICVNRQARRNFEILETLEAGISLKGTEVKSIRDGKMNLQDAFVKPSFDGRSCTLMNCHIGKHAMSSEYFQHEERRPRPLLVHKSEARKFKQKIDQSGMTIVPLKAYFNNDNKVKLQIALCKGKNVRDKRADIKERDMKRETSRIVKNFRL
jgi:SsrA-binding protein